MKIRQKIEAWLTELITKANRAAPARDLHSTGGDTHHKDFDADADMLAERQDANIATAIRLISEAIAGVPMRVTRQQVVDGEMQWIDDDNHEASDLLQDPNPYHSFDEIIQHVVQSLILTGNAFVGIEDEDVETEIGLELWPLETKKMELVKDSTKGYPVAFLYDPQVAKIRYETDQMWYTRLYNLNDPYYGRGRITPIHKQILTDYYVDLYHKGYFKNGAVPGGVLSTEQPLADDAIEITKKEWNRTYQGAEKANSVAVLGSGVQYQTITPPLKDMAFQDLIRLNREKIYAVIGIPPSVGGVYEYANYANAMIQEKTYWRHTLIPLARIIASTLTRQVMYKRFDDDHRFEFDLSNVEALQEDRLEKAKTYTTLVQGGIITPNEARKEYDLEPLESGDELRNHGGDLFGGGSTAGGDVGRGAVPPLHTKAASRRELWQMHDRQLQRAEIEFQNIIQKYFQAQRKRVVENVRAYTGNGKAMSRLYGYVIVHKDDAPEDADAIFDLTTENAAMTEATRSYIREKIRDTGDEFFSTYNLDATFNVRNPEVLALIQRFDSRLRKVNDVTYSKIQELLREAQDNAWTLRELEKEIHSVYTNFTATRAMTIARTEMQGVVNGGNYIAMRQGGIQKKEWLATMDAKTRDSHAHADGQVVSITEPFAVGASMMQHPGDPAGRAEDVINCRCTTLPVIE